MRDKHLRFLILAKRLACKTKGMKRQVGCIIIDGHSVVARARNMKSHTKTPQIVSTITGKRYYGLHAEINALLKCDFSVDGMVVYVYGQNSKTGNKVYSKPCELCTHYLRKRGIKTAIFVTHTGYEICDLLNNKGEFNDRIRNI